MRTDQLRPTDEVSVSKSEVGGAPRLLRGRADDGGAVVTNDYLDVALEVASARWWAVFPVL